MTIRSSFRCGLAALAAAALWASTPCALAQRGGGVTSLPEDQQALYRDFTAAVREAGREKTEQLTQARAALADAIFADKVDEAAIKEKAAAVAKIETELYVIRAKEFDKNRSKYTNADLLRLLKANAFQAGRGAGGGGGGRGRGQQ
jgi:Spy/CpxP family protein refolding chaperone